jgi:tripartite-type tricarboxylate transporter receptor subunit TctC
MQWGLSDAVMQKKIRGSVMKSLARLVLLPAALTVLGMNAFAQEGFPLKPVRIVLPVAAGSSTDSVSRLLAEQLRAKWQQSVIVDNISGGGMNIGAEHVYKSAPDGHTVMVSAPGPIIFNQHIYKNLGYDGRKFLPITLVTRSANVLVVRKTLPVKSVTELIAYAKANPGKVSYGSQGAGSTAHLSAIQLSRRADLSLIHVPYRGAMPALNDVMAGHIDMFFDNVATSAPLYRDGKVNILAVGSLERSRFLPEVPTVHESGLPKFRSTTWSVMVAPPGTPAALIARINADVTEILGSASASETILRLGVEPSPTKPAEATRFLDEESALWGEILQQSQAELMQ